MKTYDHIATTKEGSVLTITLNDPDKRNAIAGKAHEELSHVFADAAEETDVDLIILTGAGRYFSAGGDINMIRTHYKNTDWVPVMMREARKIVRDLLELEVPVIAAVNGDAVGLGATIALMCDIVVAVDTARFGDPHAKIGLVAGDGGAVIWPMLIGPARAKEYLMTGRLISAPEAASIGLINYSVAVAEFWPKVNNLAGELLANPQRAVRWTKRAVNKHVLLANQLIFDLSISLEANSLMNDDLLEACNAFLEKRPPKFTGH